MLKRYWFTIWILIITLFISERVFAKPVGVDEADVLLRQPGVWVLDVRSAEEFASGHFERAHQIPVQELETRGSELPADKSVPVLLYCRSGRRSAQADRYLTEHGYQTVYSLEGGLNAWQAAGKSVVHLSSGTSH